jgi:hypothetical protein
MSRVSRFGSFFARIGAFLILGAGYCCAQAVPSNASQNSTGLPAGWPYGVTVNVYMNTSVWGQPGSPLYQAAQNGITAMNQGMSWNANTFNFIPIDGYPANPQGYYQVVERVDSPDGNPANAGSNLYFIGTVYPGDTSAPVTGSIIELNSAITNPSALEYWTEHEEGHTFFLGDCLDCGVQNTIMDSRDPAQTMNGDAPISGPTTNDTGSAGTYDDYGAGNNPPPPPPPDGGCSSILLTPSVFPIGGTVGSVGITSSSPGLGVSSQSQTTVGSGPIREVSCNGGGGSPIIIDTEGEGFHLTSAPGGVKFDISGTGHAVQTAWTDSRFRNAFLALPGPDGMVHNGKQLFGNFTNQPPSNHPNGFLALAEFDKAEHGGNGDGVIDEKDAVYSKLRLWIDENHDGISQPNELHTLAELGVHSLALNYSQSPRTDEFGNAFRYKAKVNADESPDFRDERQHVNDNEVGRWAYDVFLVSAVK